MDTGLAGSTILITGASGGIGRAAARAFAAEGAHLALHYHQRAAQVEALVAELAVPTIAVTADLREESQVDAMYEAVLGTFPRLDAIVVNAGVWNPAVVPLHQMTLDQWHETLAADLTSAFLTCRGFLRHLAEVPRQSASIVLIGSTAAVFGEANHADYSAAKAGLTYGLTRSLKNEIIRLAPLGRVNAICPGWTNTRMAADAMARQEAIRSATATIALRKIAEPEDIAGAIVYLASGRLSGHISGSVLTVAGGMEGRLLHP